MMNRLFYYKIRLLFLFVFISFLLINCEKNVTAIERMPNYEWKCSSPEEQGMDSRVLNEANDEAGRRGFVDCILVIRNGYIVSEKYFNGYGINKAHNVRSVSKSFLSAITGIALRDSVLDSLNQKMLDFFPEYIYAGIDQRKYNITIRDLLMMRMGIENEHNNYMQIYNTSNWIKTTIELPLQHIPGLAFHYNTFQTHLLSAILTKSSGMSTLEFAKEFLFEPMSISVYNWERDPQGYYFGGNNMFFTPRNMARLGYLYMNNGTLEGEQIVPDDWVEASLTRYIDNAGSDWGELKNWNYGYLWWLGEIKEYDVFLAIGHGGQFVINFPELNMIIVTTADAYVDWDTADAHEESILDLVANYILPALND